MAAYLGAVVGEQEDPLLTKTLTVAIESKGQERDRPGFLRQALSGMPQAITPFKRKRLDIFLAAGLMQDTSRAGFRGDGNWIDAGYFTCTASEVHYVDTVNRVHNFQTELVNPLATAKLVRTLRSWAERPMVQVGDPANGEVFRLTAGTTGLKNLKIDPPANPRLANQPWRSTVSLLRLSDNDLISRVSSTPSVARVAMGQALFEREDQSLVLREVQPEFLMELHAAFLMSAEEGTSLWLHVEHYGNEFLAILPDLMEPGSTSRGWWAPIRDVSMSLGGSHGTRVTVPRWAALRLMKRNPWMWLGERDEWVRCAWWISKQASGSAPDQKETAVQRFTTTDSEATTHGAPTPYEPAETLLRSSI